MDDMTTEISEGLSAIHNLGAIAVSVLRQRETLRIGWSGSAPTGPRVDLSRRRGWVRTSERAQAGRGLRGSVGTRSHRDGQGVRAQRASQVVRWKLGHRTLHLRSAAWRLSCGHEDLLRSVVASVKEVDSVGRPLGVVRGMCMPNVWQHGHVHEAKTRNLVSLVGPSQRSSGWRAGHVLGDAGDPALHRSSLCPSGLAWRVAWSTHWVRARRFLQGRSASCSGRRRRRESSRVWARATRTVRFRHG